MPPVAAPHAATNIGNFEELRKRPEQALPDNLVNSPPDLRRAKDWREYEALLLTFPRNELAAIVKNLGGKFVGNEKGRMSRVNMMSRISDDLCMAGI